MAQKDRDEQSVKALSRILAKRGLAVRREKLTRGTAFRATSGACGLDGKQLLFIDKRLPVDQQLAVLLDYALEVKPELGSSDVTVLPKKLQDLFEVRRVFNASSASATHLTSLEARAA